MLRWEKTEIWTIETDNSDDIEGQFNFDITHDSEDDMYYPSIFSLPDEIGIYEELECFNSLEEAYQALISKINEYKVKDGWNCEIPEIQK